jgi:large subunit ribosomal protein L15
MKASRSELTLDDLMRVKGGDVTLQGLIDANLVPEYTKLVKIILSGKVTKAYSIKAFDDKTKVITATKGARSAVVAAGGNFAE